MTDRVFRPREYCKGGNAVRGFCLLRNADRIFAVSRIADIRTAEETADESLVPLYAHQREIRKRLSENNRFLLLAEMGTGKTLPMLLHIADLLGRRLIDDALIVAPLSALGAWRRDIDLLSTERRSLIEPSIAFVNYDRISRHDGSGREEYWRSWGCIVLDEGHAISNPASNRTQYFVGKGKALGLASKAKYFYLLTGTLVANSRLQDSWAPLRAVLGDDFMTYRDFRAHYMDATSDEGRVDELLQVLSRHSYRVKKADCLDLPEMMPDELVRIPLSDEIDRTTRRSARSAYVDALHSYREAFRERGVSSFGRFMLLRQIAAGFLPWGQRSEREDESPGQVVRLSSAKIQYATELIQANLPNKTVVFHEFTATGLALERSLHDQGIQSVSLNGAQSNKAVWRRFQTEPELSVIIVQYRSGAAGIDLFAASTTIYMEPPLSSTTLSQSRGRTHRSGQGSACNYYFLLSDDTVEEAIYERLRCGEDFSEQAFGEMLELGDRPTETGDAGS